MRKIVTLLLVLFILGTVAFAEGDTPSVTNVPVITDLVDVNGDPIPETLTLIVEVLDEEADKEIDENAKLILKEISDFSADRPVIEMFDEVVVEKVKELLGDDVDLNTLVVDEFEKFYLEGYTEDIGDIRVSMKFPADYKEDDKLVILVGIYEGTGEDVKVVEWIVAPVTVVDDKVVIEFSKEDLLKLNGVNAVSVLMRADDSIQ